MSIREIRAVAVLTLSLVGGAATAAENPGPIGSVSGRLIDARDGAPLSWSVDPHHSASVVLERCAGSCRFVGVATGPDTDGNFTVSTGSGESASSYRIVAYATGYEGGQGRTSDVFEVEAGEDYDLGNFALQPDRIQIASTTFCDVLPVEGGVCRFSMTVRNRSDERFAGGAWAVIYYGLREGDVTHFVQAGAGGLQNPRPRRVVVAPDGEREISLQFWVPGNWTAANSDGLACIDMHIGEGLRPVFHPAAVADVGCFAPR